MFSANFKERTRLCSEKEEGGDAKRAVGMNLMNQASRIVVEFFPITHPTAFARCITNCLYHTSFLFLFLFLTLGFPTVSDHNGMQTGRQILR